MSEVDHTTKVSTKRCVKCGAEQPETSEFFCYHTKSTGKFKNTCKRCQSLSGKQYYSEHKERVCETSARYYEENRSEILVYSRKYRERIKHVPSQDTHKTCRLCKRNLPATTEFFRIREGARFRSRCKQCMSASAKSTKPPEGFIKCGFCDSILAATKKNFPVKHGGRAYKCKKCIAITNQHVAQTFGEQKKCCGCYVVKPFGDFSRSRGEKDGRSHYCRKCKSNVSKQSYSRNRQRALNYAERYRRTNPDKVRKAKRACYVKNPQVYWDASIRRRGRKWSAEGTHTVADVHRQYKAQQGRCYWCDVYVGNTYHTDHIIPLARGGSDGPDNLVISCPPCNLSKGDKLPHEWRGNGGKMF